MTESKHAAIQIIRVHTQTAQILEQIAEDVFDYPIQLDQLKRFLEDPNAALFIAILNQVVVGQIRGFIQYRPDCPPDLYIDNLGVTPAEKRRGIASKLVEAVADWGRENGCITYWLLTETDNDEALKFYDAIGMKGTASVFLEAKI